MPCLSVFGARVPNMAAWQYVMTQVFAGINHRLSEEYTKIELPSAEAKDRYAAPARPS